MNSVQDFGKMFDPVAALVIYRNHSRLHHQAYVEYMDINREGHPVNVHPLSKREAEKLSGILQTAEEKRKAYLKPRGMMPANVLHLDIEGAGEVLWYTPPATRNLFFAGILGIPCGKAEVPALIWKATPDKLHLYAIKSRSKPRLHTPLYYAPFFNVGCRGGVCMGTVEVKAIHAESLEAFMTQWENYFFHSYFSHILGDYNPIVSNLVLLWKNLIHTGDVFPLDVLVKTGKTLKNLIS